MKLRALAAVASREMAYWKIVGDPDAYEGGSDPSADVTHGYRFTLQGQADDRSAIRVEAAKGAGEPPLGTPETP